MTSRNNHSPRDTSTGKVNEAEIESFLRENLNESVYEQAEVGTQFATGKKHIVDVLLGGSAYKKTKKAKNSNNSWRLYVGQEQERRARQDG